MYKRQYLALTQGLPNAEHSLEVNTALTKLSYTCCEKKTYRFRITSLSATFRWFASTTFTRSLYPSIPTFFDGKPFDTKSLKRYQHNKARVLAVALNPQRLTIHDSQRPSPELDSPMGQEMALRRASIDEPMTVFHQQSLEFKVLDRPSSFSALGFVPIQHGVALKPIPGELPFHGEFVFCANSLQTDFSRLELTQGEALDAKLLEAKKSMASILRQMHEQKGLYRPELSVKDVLKESATDSSVCAVVGYSLAKAYLPALAAVTLGTFAVRSARAFNLEKTSHKLAIKRTNWLTNPAIEKFIRRYMEES